MALKEGEVGAEAAREISKLIAEMFTRGIDGEDDSDLSLRAMKSWKPTKL